MSESSTTTLTTSIQPSESSISSSPSSNVILKSNKSITENSNLVTFPKAYFGKEINKLEESRIQVKKSSNTTVNEAEATYGDLMGYLQKAVELGESLDLAGKYRFNTVQNENDTRLKEAEGKMHKTQKMYNLYKYYSVVWIISALLLGVLTTLAIVGFFSPFVTFSGILAVVTGIVGAYIDWKDREKRYDF